MFGFHRSCNNGQVQENLRPGQTATAGARTDGKQCVGLGALFSVDPRSSLQASGLAPLRFVRSGAVTAAVVGLAAVAHLAAGGRLPPLPLIMLLVALVMVPATALTRVRLSIPVLGAMLTLGQGALHFAFIALSGASDRCAAAAVAAHGYHQGAGIPDCAPAGTVALLEGGVASVPGTTAMTAAHIFGTALTVLVLARAEAVLWQVRDWLRPLIHAPQLLRQPPALRVAAAGSTFRPLPAPGTRITAPRGPPSGVMPPTR